MLEVWIPPGQFDKKTLDLVKKLKKTKGEIKQADRLALVEVLRKNPALASCLGDFAPVIRRGVVNELVNGDPVMKESVVQHLTNMAAELGYEKSTGLERMLIENVLTCWAQLQRTEAGADGVWSKSHDFERGRYWDRRLTAAQLRFLRASETLRRARQRLGPVLQFNLAEQQVNVAG